MYEENMISNKTQPCGQLNLALDVSSAFVLLKVRQMTLVLCDSVRQRRMRDLFSDIANNKTEANFSPAQKFFASYISTKS